MPYIYIDDGKPDSREYDSNYLFYDEADIEHMVTVLELIDRRSGAGGKSLSAERRVLELAIEKRRKLDREQNRADAERGGRWLSPARSLFGSILTRLRASAPCRVDPVGARS